MGVHYLVLPRRRVLYSKKQLNGCTLFSITPEASTIWNKTADLANIIQEVSTIWQKTTECAGYCGIAVRSDLQSGVVDWP